MDKKSWSKIRAIIYSTPPTRDADDVRFEMNGKEIYGYGFRPKATNRIYLVRCPACGRENYARNVSSGICTWCGFEAKM